MLKSGSQTVNPANSNPQPKLKLKPKPQPKHHPKPNTDNPNLNLKTRSYPSNNPLKLRGDHWEGGLVD